MKKMLGNLIVRLLSPLAYPLVKFLNQRSRPKSTGRKAQVKKIRTNEHSMELRRDQLNGLSNGIPNRSGLETRTQSKISDVMVMLPRLKDPEIIEANDYIYDIFDGEIE